MNEKRGFVLEMVVKQCLHIRASLPGKSASDTLNVLKVINSFWIISDPFILGRGLFN